MKKSSVTVFLIFLIILISHGKAASQGFNVPNNGSSENKSAPEIKIENVFLKFSLSGTPSAEEIGFSDPKSSWKLEYELRIADESALTAITTKVYAKKQKTGEKSVWLPKVNRQVYKKMRKAGMFVAKGKITQKNIQSEESRDLTFTVNLDSKVREILTRMQQSAERPSFVLSIKGKISTKTPNQFSYKKKYDMTLEYPMKLYSNEKNLVLYNTFGMALDLTREKDRIFLGVTRR